MVMVKSLDLNWSYLNYFQSSKLKPCSDKYSFMLFLLVFRPFDGFLLISTENKIHFEFAP
jgi:hypothetical protein